MKNELTGACRMTTEEYASQRISSTAFKLEIEEFESLANKPANAIALVDALEKAQQRIDELEGALEVSQEDLSDTEDAMHLWAERAKKAESDLESRTVKLPDDEDGQAYGFGKWASGKLPATAGTMTIAYCEDAWRAAFEVFSTAAGIKWEGE